MGLLIMLMLGVAAASYYEEQFEKMSKDLAKTKSKMTWEFGLNDNFRGMTEQQLRALFKGYKQGVKDLPRYKSSDRHRTVTLPDSFDARQKWPKCKSMKLIRDQSHCGSCWAVSAASVMSDKHCIVSKGEEQPYVSDQYILTCCGSYCGYGCDGGYYTRALLLWKKNGIPTGGMYGTQDSCQPYTIHPGSPFGTPPCSMKCIPGYPKTLESDLHYGLEAFSTGPNETEIMQEIYEYGPIIAGFVVYEDYMFYRSGVYHHVWGSEYGAHAIKVIGWGVENGEKYWLMSNSYGPRFGEQGMFKIRRGTDECEVEDYMATGDAKLYKP